MNLKFYLLFFTLLVVVPLTSAASLEINISENGKVTSFYDDYYVVQVNGTITITNPADTGLYNIEIPLYLSTLTIRSFNNSDDNYIDNEKIFILSLQANSSVSFSYEIVGITTENLNQGGSAILNTAITSNNPKIYSNVMGTLYKAPLEIPALGGRNTTRVVSVHLVNPTAFEFNIDLVKVIKTSLLDPNQELASWDFSSEKTVLEGFETYKYDILDTDAYEGEIYWLQSDVYIDDITIEANENVTRYTQEDLFQIPLNETNITENASSDTILEKRIFVRKLVDTTLVIPGKSQNVSIIVNNFGNTQLIGSLEDSLPEGFEITKSLTEGETISEDGEIIWDIDLNPRSSRRYQYEISFVDTESVGVDYFDPAIVTYGSEKVYSRSIPFVRQYVPDKKVYVQKSLDFRANGDVEVTITVRNLGEVQLADLVIREYLGSDNEFKEITKPFTEKGVWRIEQLDPGEIWETKYVTDKTNVLNSFPDVYGVSRASVFQNILLKNVVESTFKVLDVNSIEIIGIVVLILGLLVYILPRSFMLSMKKKFVKDLYLTRRELNQLKQSTSLHHQAPGTNSGTGAAQPASNIPPQQQYQEQQKYHSIHDQQRQAREQQLQQTQKVLEKIKDELNKKD